VTTVHLRRLLVALIGVLLLVAGCSNIPPETQPQPLDLGSGQGAAVSVQQPPKNATPLEIVRDFVEASANPADKHAAARVYLAPVARSNWNDGGSVTIIQDTFNTVASSEETRDPNTQDVLVHVQIFGTLGADDGFQPASGNTEYDPEIRVAKQKDGEWRIVSAPDGVLITVTGFGHAYSSFPVYFFDPNLGALVPDLRYVPTEPHDGLAARVVDELLTGPSDAMNGAVISAIPGGVETVTTPAEASDGSGSLVVNLAKLPDEPYHNKQLIIAQIVRSLQQVTTNPIRIETEGAPLIAAHLNWQASELPSYNQSVTPNGTLPGLVVVDGKVVSMKDGSPVAGPAGSGAYQVVTAAQSIDGNELAMVCQTPAGEQLRIGDYGHDAAVVPTQVATTFTRPTWMPGDTGGDPSHEVWTVANGQVVRLLSTQSGSWYAASVDATALLAFGTITDLRLSRDGTRVAAIVGGHLLVGAVVFDQDAVSIKQVTQLQVGLVSGAVGVDWVTQDELVVATNQPMEPVATVSVDGFDLHKYNTSNLTNPIAAITAAESRPVVVADPIGLWSSADTGEVWLPQAHDQPAGAIPFYPG
jgi:Lipoprotein LpqB beta-propeller domain/Sporulation and spore germination